MIAYLDCSSGISGDMLLGAFVDAGMPIKEIERGLSHLGLKGYRLNVRDVKRAGFRATKVDVIQESGVRGQESVAKKWKDIRKIIKTSTLPNQIKQNGLKIFKRLFEAEARVHGERLGDVHLHELGALDCIIDIIGTLICIDFFRIERLYSSPLNLGSGSISTEHGRLSIPAPATIELLKGIPVYSSGIAFELTTPTGAAIVSTLSMNFGTIPEMSVSKIGVGAGNKDIKGQPNVLRIFVGEGFEEQRFRDKDGIMVIETNIDDMNPQAYEYLMERLFKRGALDVFLTNIIMKKGRPGIKLSVLCSVNYMDGLIDLIFRETTTIGLRFYHAGRRVLQREMRSVDTRFGRVSVKVSRLGDEVIRVSPEYNECLRISRREGIPLLEVMREITPSLLTNCDKER
ncbi:MAG: nickel pincer cofactor biosynthesis protein LarC [Thermodesulfovibrionia bacterium]